MKKDVFLTNTGLAVLIWLATHVLAATIYVSARHLGFDFNYLGCDWCAPELSFILLVGLVVSFPIVFLLMPVLFLIPFFIRKTDRILFTLFGLLIASAIVILFFIEVFHVSAKDRAATLLFVLPYVPCGIAAFFLLTKKMFRTDFNASIYQQ